MSNIDELFNENMSSREIEQAYIKYIQTHRDDPNIELVIEKFSDTYRKILKRQLRENDGWMTE